MGTMHPLDQILQRAFSQISAEAFITDFVRQAIEANRYRGNPPASQFGIDHLKEDTMLNECGEACTVCQDVLEQGAVTLSMPCGHSFHKECLMPWLQEHNTCPICRCEIESHCPRYNQQNFEKLKGELDKETVCITCILLPRLHVCFFSFDFLYSFASAARPAAPSVLPCPCRPLRFFRRNRNQ